MLFDCTLTHPKWIGRLDVKESKEFLTAKF